MASKRPGWSVGPKKRSYHDEIFWYTPSTKSVWTAVTDNALVATSDPPNSSSSRARGDSNNGITGPQQVECWTGYSAGSRVVPESRARLYQLSSKEVHQR